MPSVWVTLLRWMPNGAQPAESETVKLASGTGLILRLIVSLPWQATLAVSFRVVIWT